jgi:4-hydroxybenzoate polyprenyltransferase
VPATPAQSKIKNPKSKIATFLDLIKFAHTIFALPFALIAAFWSFRQAAIAPVSAGGVGRLALILACMVIARTWAMTFNRLVDLPFDASNPRTARRPSVTGEVTVGFMKGTLVACVLAFLAATAGFLAWGNWWPLSLAVPVLAWLAAYSFTKRFTAWCHFWLGASLGLAPVSAWLAIAPPAVPPLSGQGLTVVLLGLAVAFWVAGFDILYALQDETLDRAMALKSIPAAWGRRRAIWLSRGCHVAAAGVFLAVGLVGNFHVLYWIGFGCAGGLLVVEQLLVSPGDISRITIAFMTANGLIGLVFGGLAIADVLCCP